MAAFPERAAPLASRTHQMEGRAYATPDDVLAVAPYTLSHRITLSGDARFAGKTAESVLDDILKSVPMPELV